MENRKASAELNRIMVRILLQSGLWLSISLMLFGILLNISQGHSEVKLLGLKDLFSPTESLANRLLIWGVFVLALTPVFRVGALVLLWIKEKDWRFVAVALFVLATLSISIFSA